MTVMGDALRDRLSDRGSIPLRSTKNTLFYKGSRDAKRECRKITEESVTLRHSLFCF